MQKVEKMFCDSCQRLVVGPAHFAFDNDRVHYDFCSAQCLWEYIRSLVFLQREFSRMHLASEFESQ